MTTLPPTTRSRLQKIPLANVVWEGDRRPLGNMASHLDGVKDANEECIIWVDGSEGAVRAMDVVAKEMGLEAVVRTLLRAIESPHHPSPPNRPQKIVVRDREIQFFLRGVLQELDINIEYSPQLPLIDRLFEGFAVMDDAQPSPLPALYEDAITEVASQIWHHAPWELLADSDILQVELKDCEINQVYLCVMGMMSAEYGVLIYRSLESLQQFRAAALGENQSAAELEQAFLAQDCWFLNYEETTDDDVADAANIEPFFGSLHPFEGMRHSLDEAETKIVYATLESLLRFYTRNRSALSQEPIETLSKSYRITLPKLNDAKQTISTKVSTLPELTAELLDMGQSDRAGSLAEAVDIPIQEDLIPNGSLISLASIPQELIQQLQHQPKTYCQSATVSHQATEIPTIFIQTTRPKAQDLISRIRNAGGLKAVCFNPGHDPFSGEVYDLGMLQTKDDELYIFAEYSQDVVQQAKALEKWHQRCKKTHGYCSLVIAMGATGANRGSPRAKDMLALFEVKSINGAELGMGVLQLMPSFDFSQDPNI
ncbi:MAG: hypothetical protein AAFW67_05120 [Cyanobacteria bacterium J06638_38]